MIEIKRSNSANSKRWPEVNGGVQVYGLRVSDDLSSRVTDAVLEEVSDWQNRALEPMYPVVLLDALRVKIRDA